MSMSISKLFIVSSSYELIASNDYRDDVSDSCVANFMQKIKSTDHKVLQPHFVCSNAHFYHIRRNKIYFAACSATEVFPVMVIEMLSRFYHICKDFCGVVSEQSLQANLLLVYEILQEFMNEGYVQLESSEKIQPYIQSTPVIVHTEKSPVKEISTRVFGIESKTSMGKSISQSPSESEKTGFYVDVIEKMVAVVAADGTVSHMEVNGSLVVRNFLAGSPQFKMFLNDDLVVAEPNVKGYGNQVQLDRCSFHDCVNHDDFTNKRYLVLAPPVGEFSAMTYTASGELCLCQPFILRLFVDDASSTRDLRVTLRLKSNFPSNVQATKVKLKMPVPHSVSSISTRLCADDQRADFSKEDSSVTWCMSRFPGQTEYAAELRLNNQSASTISRRDLDPVSLDFEISGFTSTRLAIRHLKAHNTDKVQQRQHFVRHITVSESYMFRTF